VGLSSYLALLIIYPLYISTRKGNSPLLIRFVWNFNSSVTYIACNVDVFVINYKGINMLVTFLQIIQHCSKVSWHSVLDPHMNQVRYRESRLDNWFLIHNTWFLHKSPNWNRLCLVSSICLVSQETTKQIRQTKPNPKFFPTFQNVSHELYT